VQFDGGGVCGGSGVYIKCYNAISCGLVYNDLDYHAISCAYPTPLHIIYQKGSKLVDEKTLCL
jgi:hypothetical protein